MGMRNDQTARERALREQFIAKVNALVADAREDLIPDLTDEYSRLVEAARAQRRSAA
jgi:hypothetical protein